MPKSKAQRFPILTSPLWRPFLLPFGVTAERSFASVEDGSLHVRFGQIFDHKFPLEEIEGATLATWPLWAGIGPRTNFRGSVGLVGTYVNIVEVQFKEPQKVRMLVPVTCQRLYLSMEEPHAFVAALGKRPAEERHEEAARAAA